MLKVLYFARLVNAIGKASDEFPMPASVKDVASLLEWLKRREGSKWPKEYDATNLQVTVNKAFEDMNTPLKDGDEVAFIPKLR
jgi:molybdopterin synthase sulfur carrier subunit